MTRQSARSILLSGLMAMCMFYVRPASAQTRTNYWTGAAESDNNWSTAGNWSLLEAPAEGDRVVFGDDPGGVAQVITLDVEPTIHELWISATDTGYTLNAVDSERVLLSSHTYAVRMTAEAKINALLNVPLRCISSSPAYIRNESTDARLIVGPDGGFSSAATSGYHWYAGGGLIEVRGQIMARGRMDNDARVIAAREEGTISTTHVYLRNNSELLLARDTALGGEVHNQTDTVMTSRVAIVDSGTEDRTLSIMLSHIRGVPGQVLQAVESPDGSSGHLTIQFYHMRADSLSIDTIANSTVEFASHATAPTAGEMLASDNPGVSGAGNVRLKRNASTTSFGIARAMTYTGRTMLDTGILQLNTGGALPTNTIVEIGSSASFNLNGQASLVGGLSDYEGTAGHILLNGGALTVNAQADSGFSGTFTGTGAVIKAGAAALTLSNDFTQVAGRTLRVEDGLLAVTGALSVAAGTFELAGGRITAGSLASEGNAWNVTLHESNEDQVLVDVAGNADITSATLVLGLADGYKPEYGKEYTLLYAGSITGAGEGGLLFGIEDGDSFVQNGQEYMIRWENGSEQIILTAIPEPGGLALLALTAAGLLIRRRRR